MNTIEVRLMPSIHEDTRYPFSKPYGFIRIGKTPLAYGFTSIHSNFQFFSCVSGKFVELSNLYKELDSLSEDERIAFWNYMIMHDLYYELMRDDSKLRPIPQNIKMGTYQRYARK